MLEEIERDFRTAAVDEKRRALLIYVEKLTLNPGEVRQDDVRALQQAGHSDADVLAIAEVAGYYAYVNRIADGLGVELEPSPESENQ